MPPSPQIEVEPTVCTVCRSSGATPEAHGKDYLHKTSDQDYQFCRCLSCGHLYLNPRPAIAEIGRIYPPEYGTFTKRFGRSDSLFARIKDKVLLGRFDALAALVPETMRLLDVGCGDGRFLMALRRRFPTGQLTGLDWFFGPAVANELDSAGIKTIVGAIETTSLPDKSFDVITMNQLIEHVWDVRLVIDRCKNALKVGGLLAIETPNPDGWDRRFFRAGAWGGYYWPRHLNLFTRDHLSRIVAESGMEVVTSQSLLSPPGWIYSCQFAARRAGLGDWFNKVFSDTSIPLLAAFAIVDWIALRAGAETSNQKLIARRPS
jgi:2-polyprenyl-3-methyl-5-hydroxy-6-metoxy-1,4-benzoquinol methylase